MITKFETGSGAPATTKSGSDNTLLYLGIAVVGGFLLYKFVIKPYLDKKKAEEGQTQAK